MPNWLTSCIQVLITNPYLQLFALVATLIGGWAAVDYFWQKHKVDKQQIIVNKSLL